METLRYNGFEIAYERYGDPEAPAIVLIMGLAMTSACWPRTLISVLVQEGFQVIAPDNRDSGASIHMTETKLTAQDVLLNIGRFLIGKPIVGAAYALEDMAFDVERLLNHLKIRRAHVVGVSMGGMIAQVMATQCPNRVASLVSIASASGNPKTGWGNIKAIWTLLRKPSNPKYQYQYHADVCRTLAGPGYMPDEEELEKMLSVVPELNCDDEATARQVLSILTSGDRREQLKNIQAPTLVVHGDADPLLPVAAGKEVAQLIPNAELVLIPQMGHQLPEKLMPRLGTMIAMHCHRYPA